MKRILYILAALLSFYTTNAQVDLPTGNIEAWYPFCSDFTDHGGLGYDLIGNNVTLASDRYLHPGMAWAFNGINSEMHYTSFFPMTIAGNFCYSAWIYPTIAQNSIIFYNGNPNSDGMGLAMDDGALGIGTKVSIRVGGLGDQLSSTNLPLGQWHHVVLVKTGLAYVLYINSTYVGAYLPVTTPSFPGFFLPALSPVPGVFQVGANVSSSNSYFTGRIDDIAVYSRVITYPTEINKLRDYNPDIVFSLGNDTSIAPKAITLPLPPAFGPSFATIYPYPIYHWRYDTLVGTSTYFFDSASSPATQFVSDTPSNTGTTIILTITRPLSTLPYGNVGNACIGRDTIKINHIAVAINLGNDTTFCKGGELVLNNPPAPGETFEFRKGSTVYHQDTLHVSTAGTYVINVDSTYTDALGHVITATGTDTIVVHVPDSIHVHLGINDTLCFGGTDTLYSLDTSTYGSPQYMWGQVGPGGSGVAGLTTSIAVASVSGTYYLQVTDSSCVAADTIQVVIVYDSVTVFNADTAICKGQHVVTVASFNPDLTYQWRPSAGMPSSANPATTITPDTSAWYVLTATIDSIGQRCIAKDSFFLDVQPNPYVYAGGNRFVCTHDSIRIEPKVEPSWYTHYTYDWTPGDYLNDSTKGVVIFRPGDTTKYYLTVSTPAGCTGRDSAVIFTYEGDFASLSPVLRVCPGESVVLAPTSTQGPTTYHWYPSTYLDNPEAENPTINAIVSEDYYAVATSQYGCKDTVYLHVIVNPGAVITMVDSVQIAPGESYHITPQTNVTRFSWTPTIGLNDTSISNPIATPPVNTTYILTGYTENNCFIRDSIAIRVDAGSFMTVPNAFTPGFGNNNVLHILMSGLAKLRTFKIYNRWGNLVYTTNNVEEGWDGNFNGKPQPMGVYMYELEAVTDQGVVLKKQGNITLLR